MSEVWLSNVECNNRIDAECYKKINIFYHQIIDNYSYALISDFAEVTDGEHGSPELDENSGIAYLSGHNVKDNILDLNDIRYCSKNLHNRNMRSALSKNNVLLSIVGTVGNSSVVYKELEANTDRNVATIKKISTTVNPYYLSTFLNSKYGRKQTEILSTGNVQPLLNLNQVKSIKVCLPSLHFQSQIETIVELAHSKVEESKQLYVAAEDQLLSELGLKGWQPNNNNINVKTLKESFLSSGRLDAEYYQSKYDEIETKIKKYHGGFQSLINYVSDYSTGQPFDSNLFTDCGCNVIRINNIKNGELDLSNAVCVPTESIDVDMKDLVKKNDILISMSGTIGNCCVIRENIFAAINQRILKIVPKNYDSNVLCLVIDSIIGKTQFDRIGTGGVQTNISSKDMFQILIPKLPMSIQDEISTKVKKSFALKAESKRLLEEAKLMVEQEIEKGSK